IRPKNNLQDEKEGLRLRAEGKKIEQQIAPARRTTPEAANDRALSTLGCHEQPRRRFGRENGIQERAVSVTIEANWMICSSDCETGSLGVENDDATASAFRKISRFLHIPHESSTNTAEHSEANRYTMWTLKPRAITRAKST
ncbi:1179_t:CDS:1, partial [Acaulospora colombiana]